MDTVCVCVCVRACVCACVHNFANISVRLLIVHTVLLMLSKYCRVFLRLIFSCMCLHRIVQLKYCENSIPHLL